MSKYIDESGLNYLWGKVKSYVSGLGFYTKPSTGIPASDIASGVIPDVSGKENTSNKVTSLSSTSTDTQYPSAKAVYDLVNSIPVSSGGVWVDITPKFTTWTAQKYISSVDGSYNSSSVSQSFACDYVDISDYTNIQISLPHLNANSPAGGCFYDANKQAITPGLNKAANNPTGMYPYVFAVPVNAKYVRVTWRKDIGGLSFSCYGFTKITVG